MDVKLYVYDLSRGMARQFSGALLGTYIDAVYHTALVFGGVEYFYGAGIQTSYPGATHHGQPVEVVPLGKTEIDTPTALEYIDSLKAVYSAESYDLFNNNCNNFTNDLAMFLVGKGIPKHITSLPATVLATPFGQMLKPQLDQAMRGVTQAPMAPSAIPPAASRPTTNGTASTSALASGRVHVVSSLSQLDSLLAAARAAGAVIFFTSQTCPPCKICYPAYDALAEEAAGKLILIKVDVGKAYDVSMRYQVRATPTFMTFLRGEKLDEWKGADVVALQGNVRLLMEMVKPTHPHLRLSTPNLRKSAGRPVLYEKVPPLEKLRAQLGDKAEDPSVEALVHFVKARSGSAKAAETTLPDMPSVSAFIRGSLATMEPKRLFALIDLLRLALIDPRFSGYVAEEPEDSSVLLKLLAFVGDEKAEVPYSLRITTVQATCNMFSSPLGHQTLLGKDAYTKPLVALVTGALLDEEHVPLRVSAASLAFNVTCSVYRRRTSDKPDLLGEEPQVELIASILEAIDRETNKDAAKGLLLSVGLLSFMRPINGELDDVLNAMQAAVTVNAKKSDGNKELVQEIAQILAPP